MSNARKRRKNNIFSVGIGKKMLLLHRKSIILKYHLVCVVRLKA